MAERRVFVACRPAVMQQWQNKFQPPLLYLYIDIFRHKHKQRTVSSLNIDLSFSTTTIPKTTCLQHQPTACLANADWLGDWRESAFPSHTKSSERRHQTSVIATPLQSFWLRLRGISHKGESCLHMYRAPRTELPFYFSDHVVFTRACLTCTHIYLITPHMPSLAAKTYIGWRRRNWQCLL